MLRRPPSSATWGPPSVSYRRVFAILRLQDKGNFLATVCGQGSGSISTIEAVDNRFPYAPNVSAASFMLARIDTPKGQRFSQAPQATHSPALWGSAA